MNKKSFGKRGNFGSVVRKADSFHTETSSEKRFRCVPVIHCTRLFGYFIHFVNRLSFFSLS